MNLELGSAGAYFSNGGLVLALNPLKERFQWNITTNTNAEFNELNEHDSVLATINLQKDFIGTRRVSCKASGRHRKRSTQCHY